MEKHKKLAVTEEEKSINIVDLFVYPGRSLEMVSSVHFAVWRMFRIFTVRHHLRTAG